jgi:hypothetical protein
LLYTVINHSTRSIVVIGQFSSYFDVKIIRA